jgi:hypothetical protein
MYRHERPNWEKGLAMSLQRPKTYPQWWLPTTNFPKFFAIPSGFRGQTVDRIAGLVVI